MQANKVQKLLQLHFAFNVTEWLFTSALSQDETNEFLPLGF